MVASELQDLAQRFGGDAPVASEDLCLNRTHRQAGCVRCASACPTQAIALVSGAPSLAEEDCVHCGSCVAICPTDAFGAELRPERLLLRTGRELPPAALALVCGLHPHPTTTALPVGQILRHNRCLAALSPTHLLALAAHGERGLWVDDTPCSTCIIGATHGQLVRSVRQADQLLAIAGLPGNIRLADSAPEHAGGRPVPRPLAEGDRLVISRRGLFSTLGKALRGGDRAGTSEDQRPSAPKEGDDSHLPASRIALLAWLQRHPPAAQAGSEKASLSITDLPFTAVHVDPLACSGCGLCARLCPTDALQFDGNTVRLSSPSEPFSLTFHPGWCIDCGICQVICPEKAVIAGPCPPPEVFAGDTPLLLVAGDLVPCAKCQSPTTHHTTDSGPICHVCRSLLSDAWSDNPFA